MISYLKHKLLNMEPYRCVFMIIFLLMIPIPILLCIIMKGSWLMCLLSSGIAATNVGSVFFFEEINELNRLSGNHFPDQYEADDEYRLQGNSGSSAFLWIIGLVAAFTLCIGGANLFPYVNAAIEWIGVRAGWIFRFIDEALTQLFDSLSHMISGY